MTERERILSHAMKRFFSRGFNRVTTEQLAFELGISKKTLYRHFPSKEELLLAGVNRELKAVKSRLDKAIADRDADFYGKARALLEVATDQIGKISRDFMEDMYRHAPGIWERIDSFRRKSVYSTWESIIQEGRSRGILKPGLEPGLVRAMLISFIENILTPEHLIRFSVPPIVILESFITILFTGILSEEARARFIQGGSAV